MMKDYSELVVSLTVEDLLRYTIAQSDSNASSLMLKDMVNVTQTDSFTATLIPRSSFQITHTEEGMSADHDRAYSNYTSPLGVTISMSRLLTEGIVSGEKQSFIKDTLEGCVADTNRIIVPFLDKERVSITHKTDSGYVDEDGILVAHNDVAYMCLPNNVCYTLAISVENFEGNESQAS